MKTEKKLNSKYNEIQRKLKTYTPFFIGMLVIPIIALYLSLAPRSDLVIIIFFIISVLWILIFIKLGFNIYKSFKELENDLL